MGRDHTKMMGTDERLWWWERRDSPTADPAFVQASPGEVVLRQSYAVDSPVPSLLVYDRQHAEYIVSALDDAFPGLMRDMKRGAWTRS
jgi:hypothetical protein